MPLLSDERRAELEARQTRYQQITDSFKPFYAVHCRLCNWASNGWSVEAALDANRNHEASHPEYQEWRGLIASLGELLELLHDHECRMIRCACKCGCVSDQFCGLVGGDLCPGCLLREGRGDAEHGLVVQEPTHRGWSGEKVKWVMDKMERTSEK